MVRRLSSLKRFRSVICTVLVALWASNALGQSDDGSDKARALFREARTLVAERQYAEACPKFEQSLAIERGIGTMYNLADCWEKLGKMASAHKMFLSAAEASRSMGQAERSRMARDRAAAIAPKLARLLVTVGTPAEGITIWRDKKQIHQNTWGTATPIDPGAYEIRATAPGKQPWTARVEIPDLATTISVTVPPLSDEAKGAAPSVSEKPKGKPAAQPRREPAPLPAPEKPAQADSSPGNSRTVALAVGAAGLGALVAGVVLALDYTSKNDEAGDICPSAVNCSRAEIDRHGQLVDDARTSRNWSYLAFGIGGAAVLGAGAIYITSAPTSSPRRAAVSVSPLLGATGPMGAAVHGNW